MSQEQRGGAVPVVGDGGIDAVRPAGRHAAGYGCGAVVRSIGAVRSVGAVELFVRSGEVASVLSSSPVLLSSSVLSGSAVLRSAGC